MKIKSMIGWEENYVKFEVDNSNPYYCQGDMFWCGYDDIHGYGSCDEEVLLVHETVTREDIESWAKENDLPSSQRKVLLGMLTQAGVI
ncbi:hypothetical protein vBVpaMR16F_191 [Vibrio phage vB_VpaM_R16F]|nr:hypothetical protein vBVpaMR16F_191 [Vibrio phage vB_VpaM_R16F]